MDIEQLAAIEHERWAEWQRYLHSLCVQNLDGSLTIPAGSVAHWSRQIRTPYAALSEREKESDREQVRRYLPVIDARYAPLLVAAADACAAAAMTRTGWTLDVALAALYEALTPLLIGREVGVPLFGRRAIIRRSLGAGRYQLQLLTDGEPAAYVDLPIGSIDL